MIPEPVKIKKILYATDLSENARLAWSYAVDLANKYCAQLVILHVLDKIPEIVDSWVVGYIGAEQWEELKSSYDEETEKVLMRERRGREFMHKILSHLKDENRTCYSQATEIEDEAVVRRGNPVQKILETAEEKECDMIVMGSHGHGNLLDAMLGVTANRIIRRSTIPVMVVRIEKDKE